MPFVSFRVAACAAVVASSVVSLNAWADQCEVLTPWQKDRATALINAGQNLSSRYIYTFCEPCGERVGQLVFVHTLGYTRFGNTSNLVLTANGQPLDLAYTYVFNRTHYRWENVGFDVGCSITGVSRYLYPRS